MSFALSTRYPGRAGAPSAEYPFGSAIDETVGGAEDGTPLQADWLNDIQGFCQKVHDEAGKTAADLTGVPDTALESDLWDSLMLRGIIPLDALGTGDATMSRNTSTLGLSVEAVSMGNTSGKETSLTSTGLVASHTDTGESVRVTKDYLRVYNASGDLQTEVNEIGVFHARVGFTGGTYESNVRSAMAVFAQQTTWTYSDGVITGGDITLESYGSFTPLVIFGITLHLVSTQGDRFTIPLSFQYNSTAGTIRLYHLKGQFYTDPDIFGADAYFVVNYGTVV